MEKPAISVATSQRIFQASLSFLTTWNHFLQLQSSSITMPPLLLHVFLPSCLSGLFQSPGIQDGPQERPDLLQSPVSSHRLIRELSWSLLSPPVPCFPCLLGVILFLQAPARAEYERKENIYEAFSHHNKWL